MSLCTCGMGGCQCPTHSPSRARPSDRAIAAAFWESRDISKTSDSDWVHMRACQIDDTEPRAGDSDKNVSDAAPGRYKKVSDSRCAVDGDAELDALWSDVWQFSNGMDMDLEDALIALRDYLAAQRNEGDGS